MRTKKTASRPAPHKPIQPPKTAPAPGSGGEVIAMDEAIALLKTTRPTFYRWLRAGRFKGMKLGRQWRFYRSEIERFLEGREPQVGLPVDISPLLEKLRERAAQLGLKNLGEANDLVQAINLMIRVGFHMRASDIHLALHSTAEGTTPVAVLRYRVDGVLQSAAEFDPRLLPAIVEQWKKMAACNVREKQKPQDGRILATLHDVEKDLDLRACFLPTGLGESVTVRILDRSVAPLKLDRMDYAPHDKEKLLRWLKAPWGIVLVTGPTGCGKTTVLYGCLNLVAGPERKVMTVEDPIEVYLPWVVQTAVRPGAGVTFATALRAMLRSDPDVIMIGEIRDRESLMVAIQCALTGHLVLTTLHTEDAPSGLQRMIEIGVDPFLVGDATKLVVAQRLVRVLCPDCSVARTPTAELLGQAEQMARAGELDWEALPKKFREPAGCAKCAQTGFRRRMPISEALEVTPEIGAALRRGAAVDELRTIGVGQGMTTMAADGIRRAAAGTTALAEVLRTLGIK